MSPVRIVRVKLTVTIRVSSDVLREQMGDLVTALGPNLAERVSAHVRKEKLGYYPALDYFRQQPGGIDTEFLSAAEHVAWLVGELVRRRIQSQLHEAFSHVSFESTQLLSFTLPRVRPNDPNALQALGRHYSPNDLRLMMTVSSVERASGNHDGYEKLASHKALRWLEEVFESVKIVDARVD